MLPDRPFSADRVAGIAGRDPSMVLAAFLAYLEERKVAHGVVGDDRRLAEVLSDIDVVVEPRALAAIPGLVRAFARRAGVRLVQDIQHEVVARYFVYAWPAVEGHRFLPIDICSDWLRGGRRFLSARWLLAGRVRAEAQRPDGGALSYWRPRPAANFAYYLLKKIDKGWIEADQCDFLSQEWGRDPAGCGAALARFFHGEALQTILRAASDGDWKPVAEARARLRRELRRSPRVGPRSLLGEVARVMRRLLRPTGLLVCVEATGAEYQHVAARIAREWARAFRAVTVLDGARPLTIGRYLAEVCPQLVSSTLVIAPRGPARSVGMAMAAGAAPPAVAGALSRRSRLGQYFPWAIGG